MNRLLCALFAAPLLGSCWIVPESAQPALDMSGQLATQYNNRGIPNNAREVLQAEMSVELPTKLETGFVNLRTWANFDLSNSNGDAWFPDGHAGEPSQIDLQASYSETYRGFDVTSGVVSYVLQNGDEFPFGNTAHPDTDFSEGRGETKEFFVSVSRPTVFDIVPSLTLHYDFDEVDGLYANLAAERRFPLGEKLSADLRVSLGYSDEKQSDWNYGFKESGLADLQGSGRIAWTVDANTTVHLGLHVSTIVDSTLQDWFDVMGIDSTNFWGTLGVGWSY